VTDMVIEMSKTSSRDREVAAAMIWKINIQIPKEMQYWKTET
jgi:hypothetical protein